MRSPRLCCVALLFASAVVLADDHSVIFDEDVDFSTFKTFSLRETRITSERPELNFPAVAKTIGQTIRAALTAAALKESTDRADLVVESSVTGVDYGIGPFGRANVIRPPRGGGAGQPSAATVDFTEATMVIDFKHGTSGALLWRGVYHDTETDPQKLSEALSRDAAKLLSAFPPKKGKRRP